MNRLTEPNVAPPALPPRRWLVDARRPVELGQYVSLLFGERCREADVEISIGCTSAYDHAVAESFFASLTKDLLRRHKLHSRAEARTAVFDYIETFYNPIRLHSTLHYLSPIDYEK